MATQITRQLRVGAIVDKSLAVLELGLRPVLIYLLVFTAVNVAIGYFALSLTAVMEQVGVGLAKLVVGFAAAYLLLDALIGETGLRTRADQDVFFPFIGLSVLYVLGVYAGLIAVILPGLVIMARWSIAQPLLVARGGRIMAALGESWERTKGAEFQILGAILALLVVPIALLIAGSVLFDPTDMVGIVVTNLATSVISAVSAAMGVALYGMIETASDSAVRSS
ncbi:MAG TPA: hypothetical protein VFS49_09025 [Croceibacterium sp.]|nr:hypothetical protein [Croceibacterium sp.]